uniref:sulfite exporter TauE/SafE family protein n=1 Tax=Pseudomonas aeruginosa TaxID=287 RepID=UPI00106CA245
MLSLTGGVLGLIIGAVLGLTGAGGGIFAVPALVFGLGMDIRQAAPVALLAVGAAATLGALQGLRQGVVRYKAAMMLAAAGAVTAPLGVQFAHWLSPRWLNLIFVAIMLVVAYRMFMSSRGSQTQDDLADEPARVCKISKDTGRFVWNVRTATALGSIGIVSGLATGMLGVGGGFIIVPALAHF